MIEAFRRWTFRPIDTAPMAALRIACGVLVLGWTVSLLPDVHAFLDDDGLTRTAVDGTRGWWTLDLVSPWAVVGLLVVAALALTIGWHSRVAAVLVTVLLIALQRRNVYVLNSGDLLLRHLALYVALMPSGEVWSLDARRRGASALRAPWGLRLLQVQVSLIYFFSVVAKLHGDSWQDGTAVGRAVQLADLQRFLIPEGIATSITASALLTYGTIIVEGALVFGLWLPRFRWWAMAAGVSIHLGIEATLLIGWFSLTIIACYLAFVPADVLRQVVARVTERVRPASPSPTPVPVLLAGAQPQADPSDQGVHVRVTPGEGAGLHERPRELHQGVGDVVERPGEGEVAGEVVGAVDEQPLDPVDHGGRHAGPVVQDEADDPLSIGPDRPADWWEVAPEPEPRPEGGDEDGERPPPR